MSETLLQVENLRTYFHTFRGVVKAVDGISFSLDEGQVLGIVGESGSGKSVSSFSILKLIEPPGVVESDGILFQGEDISKKSEREMMKIRGKAISMVFQDPMTSLNPLYTIEKQITEMLDLHQKQMTKQEKHARCVELLHMVGIPNPEDRLKSYPHQFSGGMRQRVIIAIALAANPKLIIADEPTTALDVTIQAQILKLMDKLVKEQDASLILITHDLAVVSQMADRIIVMYCGKIVESGSRDDVIRRPCRDGVPRGAHRPLPGGVGQLSGMAAGGFFFRRGLFPGHRRYAGQHRRPGGHRGIGPGAAFRGCPLPQRAVPLQPSLHRRAGAGPRF